MKTPALALLTLAVVACDDSFIKGWEVDRTRVLGARIEGTQVSWLVARSSRTDWAFAVCTDTHLNAPRCDSPVTAAGRGASDDELVVMDVGPLAPSSLVLAAFCANGAATLSPGDFTGTCADGAPPLLASVKTPAEPNANPAPAALFLDGQPIAPETCVAPSSKHAFGFVMRPEDREPGESLLASTTVTAGELERQYTSLGPEEPAPKEGVVAWTAPALGDASVYLVLRDSRGGTSFTRARVCVR